MMGQKNQLYGKWVRLLLSPEDPNELYLVIRKDTPMETKYIRQFENMFQGKDVILTIVTLVRNAERRKEELSEKKGDNASTEEKESPFWEVQP